MFRHKHWLLLGAAVCFAVVLVSAMFTSSGKRSNSNPSGGSEIAEPDPVAGTVEKLLKMAVSMQPKEFAVLQQLKDQYQSSHPGVDIRLENIPDETAYTKLKKAAQLGEAPDIMLLDNNWVTEFAALGYVLPVDSMFTGTMQAEQMEQALAQVKWNGYLWGVPKHLDASVIVYNTKRLSEWGDKPPTTSDDLVSLHKQAHKPEEGKYGLYFASPNYRSFLTLARVLGGAKTASKTVPLELSDLTVQKSLETFLFPSADGTKEEAKLLAKSFPQESATWKPWDQLQQGKLVGYLTTFSDWKQNESAVLTMSGIPLPKGEEMWKGPWLTGKSFSISARSPFAKEAFEWIRDLVSNAAALQFWSAAGVLPAQTSGYAAGIKNDAAFKNVAAYIDQDEAVPSAPQRVRQMTALQGQLEQLWKGEIAFKTFIERTIAEWNAILPAAKP